MIPTLQNYLFIVNRDRQAMQDKIDKRRTFLLVCAITICVAISVIIWILHPVPSFDNKTPVVQTQQGDI